MRKRTSAADTTPIRVVIVTMDSHLAGAVARARTTLARELPDAYLGMGLTAELVAELQRLAAADPELLDTTLLVHPQVLQDFDDYNDFLDVADALLAEMGLEGELQIASFHPDYRFADAEPDDVANCSNRAPYPTLHLLREDSVERAVDSEAGNAHEIVERNIRTLRELGPEGWKTLLSKP